MDDDLFASFNQPPPPSSAAAGDAHRPPAVDDKAKKSNSKGSKGSKGKGKDKAKDQGAPTSAKTKAPKRPLSPQDPPVDADSLKKLKQDTLENQPSASPAAGEPFSVTDEIEITAQTTVKPSAGFTTTAPAQPPADGSAPGTHHEEEGLVLQHQVRHQVALPPNYPYVPISQHVPPAEPARTYPFELDPFQKVSVASIQRNESVLVSAHTSAGKTVVAEYAIAQCLKQGQRVVYTSPIKVRLLSSRFFRSFEESLLTPLVTGPLEPEIPRNARRVWRRRSHDGRCHHQPDRELPRHDHRGEREDSPTRPLCPHEKLIRGARARSRPADSPVDAVPRFRDHARGGVGRV